MYGFMDKLEIVRQIDAGSLKRASESELTTMLGTPKRNGEIPLWEVESEGCSYVIRRLPDGELIVYVG